MRATSSTRRIQGSLWRLAKVGGLFCLISIALILSGCAKSKIEKERIPGSNVRKEIIRSESQPTDSESPKAKAATNLVNTGRRQLASGQTSKAQETFQNAINIDPSNGTAYYYLAKTRYELSMFEEALGVLDKAEELLQRSDDWVEAISMLREMIQENLVD